MKKKIVDNNLAILFAKDMAKEIPSCNSKTILFQIKLTPSRNHTKKKLE